MFGKMCIINIRVRFQYSNPISGVFAMSCTQATDVVARLSAKVEMMMTWDNPDSIINLMKEVISARSAAGLAAEDRDEIYRLGAKVEERVIELIQEEVRRLVIDWEMECSARAMRWHREQFRISAKEAPTAKIRSEFHAAANRMQDLLRQSSEEMAEYLVAGIEEAVACVEGILARSACEDLRAASANLDSAEADLRKLRTTPHLFHVGLPKAAKGRDLSVDELLASFGRRIAVAEEGLEALQKQKDEQDRALAKQELARARREYEQRQREGYIARQKQSVDDAIAALERRTPQLKGIGSRFKENLRLGNLSTANACLNEIRRKDGGIPPALQEEYARHLQGE